MTSFYSWLQGNRIRFFLFLFFLHFFLRISGLYTPILDVDESQFAGFAHVLMDGGLPYQDSLDTKPPLIYLFYWACFALFGKYNMTGVHLVSIFWAWGVSLLLYQTARENGHERAGFWAALFYAIFSTAYLPKFIATSITSVMVLPLVLSVTLWLRGEKRGNGVLLFLSGLATGVAFLLKYQGGMQIVVFFTFILGLIFLKRKSFRQGTLQYGLYFIGFLTPLVLTFLALRSIGVWDDFVLWSFSGSAHYLKAGQATVPFWNNLLERGGLFIISTFTLWFLTVRYFISSDWRQSLKEDNLTLLTILWFFLSLVPVATGGRFYGHYFLQLLSPLCLLAAMMAARLTSAKALKWITAGMVIPALFYWTLRLDQRTIYEYFPDDQIHEQESVGRWIKANTRSDEKIFVWGFATGIYFHSERAPVSRFLWTDLLTGKVPGSTLSNDPTYDTRHFIRPEAWDAFWEDVKRAPPDYFIDTSSCNIHHYGKYPLHKYPDLYRWLSENYEPWQTVEKCDIHRRKTSKTL